MKAYCPQGLTFWTNSNNQKAYKKSTAKPVQKSKGWPNPQLTHPYLQAEGPRCNRIWALNSTAIHYQETNRDGGAVTPYDSDMLLTESITIFINDLLGWLSLMGIKDRTCCHGYYDKTTRKTSQVRWSISKPFCLILQFLVFLERYQILTAYSAGYCYYTHSHGTWKQYRQTEGSVKAIHFAAPPRPRVIPHSNKGMRGLRTLS